MRESIPYAAVAFDHPSRLPLDPDPKDPCGSSCKSWSPSFTSAPPLRPPFQAMGKRGRIDALVYLYGTTKAEKKILLRSEIDLTELDLSTYSSEQTIHCGCVPKAPTRGDIATGGLHGDLIDRIFPEPWDYEYIDNPDEPWTAESLAIVRQNRSQMLEDVGTDGHHFTTLREAVAAAEAARKLRTDYDSSEKVVGREALQEYLPAKELDGHKTGRSGKKAAWGGLHIFDMTLKTNNPMDHCDLEAMRAWCNSKAAAGGKQAQSAKVVLEMILTNAPHQDGAAKLGISTAAFQKQMERARKSAAIMRQTTTARKKSVPMR